MRRLVAAAEAKVEKRCVSTHQPLKPNWSSRGLCALTKVDVDRVCAQEEEVARLKLDIGRQVAEATRRSRKETEQRVAETLRAADYAVITARGLCELRRRDGPRLAG